MKVLITGHNGYVGSVLVSVLRHAGFEVAGLDCDLFQGCDFGRMQEAIPGLHLDLRDIEVVDLLTFDAVIHLATVPEASSYDLPAEVVNEINEAATIRLALLSRMAGVTRFLFASSCEVYGRSGGEWLDETSPTACTIAKTRCEQAILSMAGTTFAPTVLRQANVYGVSPRLRLDLVVNDFVGAAVTTGQVLLLTDGSAWRPLVHIEDLARAYAAMLNAPIDRVSRETFNIASHSQNLRLIDIADTVAEWVPNTTRDVRLHAPNEAGYRVSGSKFAQAFPEFSFRWTVEEGIAQLRNAMSDATLTPGDWRSDRYRRAMHLQTLIESGRLSPSLRQARTAVA